MFVPTNRVEPTSPNTHADLTSIKERRINSTSRPIEDVNSGKNEVLFNEKKTLKRHLGLFSGISFILGIGSVHLRTGDILAFVFNWANTFILEPSSVAILSLTFSTYFLSGIMDRVLGTVNGISVTAANRLNIAFVVCKTVTILVITIGGLVRIGQGYTQTLKSGFDGTANNPLSISLAFYSGLWAYSGWASLNSVTEELKNPKRNKLGFKGLTNSEVVLNAEASTWGEAVLGPVVRLLPILISFSALGSANATIYTSGRYFMVGARYGYLPEIFSCIQKQRLTPLPSIILITILTIIYCIPSNIGNLIDFFSFVAWVFFGLTFVATICCKFTKPKAFRVIKVPIPIIIFMILVAIYLVIAPVISSPNVGYLIAVIILLVEKINMFFQEFFDLTIAAVNIEA
ncbi:unnamed protein product [Rotaria sordida]|uniref:B(0,+)-type amino acid transporter 1 n=2 Tax=Rotaria sordida TaxID=392033 RepID=A0A819BAR8_9BILA|nr:unnamed protein product [Rotaria sordida]